MATRPPVQPVVETVRATNVLTPAKAQVARVDSASEAARWPEKSQPRIRQKFEHLQRLMLHAERRLAGRDIPKAVADRIAELSAAIEAGKRPVMAADELNFILRRFLVRRRNGLELRRRNDFRTARPHRL